MHEYAGPYPCPTCGQEIRTVPNTAGGTLIITNRPSPTGTIIPWPSARPNGLAEARILSETPLNEPAWEIHSCP